MPSSAVALPVADALLGVSGQEAEKLPKTEKIPEPEDIPEEILRQELILEGRSRLDGRPLSPEAYAQQEEQLGQSSHPPRISAELQSLMFQLKLLHLLRSLVPGI